MSDNITLPRAVAFEMLEALTCGEHIGNFYAALYAALAAPEPEPTVKESLTVDAALAEPESDAQCPTCGGGGLVPDPTWDWVRCDVCNPLPEKPEPPVKESLTTNHIRSIWLDSWKACGNVPTPVLAEHFARQIERALAALAEPEQKPEPESKTPAWWMDGLTATLMREGVNKHRAREIAVGYWEAYCQIPGNEEDKP